MTLPVQEADVNQCTEEGHVERPRAEQVRRSVRRMQMVTAWGNTDWVVIQTTVSKD